MVSLRDLASLTCGSVSEPELESELESELLPGVNADLPDALSEAAGPRSRLGFNDTCRSKAH